MKIHKIFQHILPSDPCADAARHLHQECYTSQSLRSERDPNLTYITRANHEFYCSSTAPINHKVTADIFNEPTEVWVISHKPLCELLIA